MTKRQNTVYGAIGLLIGIVGGIAGTAFSMGAEKQRLQDTLVATNARITTVKEKQDIYEAQITREMDRYTKTIASHISQLQITIGELTRIVGDLRTDVQVLKVLMERMEEDIKIKTNPIDK